MYEVMGTDINLISANKHAEGKGAGGGGGGGGGDGWLGSMPGLGSFKPIFQAQVESEEVDTSPAEGDQAAQSDIMEESYADQEVEQAQNEAEEISDAIADDVHAQSDEVSQEQNSAEEIFAQADSEEQQQDLGVEESV